MNPNERVQRPPLEAGIFKILVGLGNPGAQYLATRHNLGSRVIDRLAAAWGVSLKKEHPHKNWVGRCSRFGQVVLLAKPSCFMNLSGEEVRKMLDHHQLKTRDLIVILDDVSLPLGSLRAREHGSAGGHNGLASIIEELGTKEFVRVRLGIDSEYRVSGDLREFVLGRFERDEEKWVEKVTAYAEEVMENILREGVSKAMSLYNKRVS